MKTDDLDYDVDGRRMVGFYAVDDSIPGSRPAVLVAPHAPGVDDFTRGRATRLASLGYAALTLDYHGEGRPHPAEEFRPRLAAFHEEPDRIRQIGQAALGRLLGQPEVDPSRVAGIGFCYGGAAVLELAREGADLRAVVGFHPRLATGRNAAPGAIRGSVLACLGADDPLVPPDERREFEEEMRAAKADWRVVLYGNAAHGFTHYRGENPPDTGYAGVAYDKLTDQRSWRAMLDLFDEVF
jgi:dienelactone hydrolase